MTRNKRTTIVHEDKEWGVNVKAEDWLYSSGEYDVRLINLPNGNYLYSYVTEIRAWCIEGADAGDVEDDDNCELDVTKEPVASAFAPILDYCARYFAVEKADMVVKNSYRPKQRNLIIALSDNAAKKMIFVRFR